MVWGEVCPNYCPLPTERTFESNNMTPFAPTVHFGPKKGRIKR